MNKVVKNNLTFYVGLFLVFYGIFAIMYAIIVRNLPDMIFWMTYITAIIIGIGAIKKDSNLIASQLNLITIYFIFWNVDFFYQLITNNSLWGITDYFFSENLIIARLISLEHVLLLPLAFYLIYIIGLKEKDHWKLSIVQGLIILIVSRIFTSPINNVNCAFLPCIPLIGFSNYYFISWILFSIVLIYLTSFLINKLFYKKN